MNDFFLLCYLIIFRNKMVNGMGMFSSILLLSFDNDNAGRMCHGGEKDNLPIHRLLPLDIPMPFKNL